MQITQTGDRHAPTGQRGATTYRPDPPAGQPPELALDVRGLRCTYGDFEAVAGIDLHAQRAELLALLGTNGAGKTTVLDALAGRRAVAAGRVRVLGMDPHRKRRVLAAQTGVMLQETALPDELTPAEFLRLWQRMTATGAGHRPVDEQLARVDLSHRRDVRIGRLSGGERRRLDLAVALSTDPALLFLDEPTAGLDPESRADTWTLIRGLLRTGTTVVLTTHYLEEADALADRLVIMHEGRVRVAGTVEEIVDAHDAYIRCEPDTIDDLPRAALIGRVEVQPRRGRPHLEIRTPDLEADLRVLLEWSGARGIPLRRLHAADATLDEVFHEIRATEFAQEVA